ncbi:DCC1-like thiol-disulfide oxidoreductase family protein [Engelhardtia mirabilis]|uniref:Vitamin K-dependent gamma-carboxylase n=1 Tax=Engelhardtia mirabilis TaxID=2528011 RepID=A0A518BSJ2_9BACT|nr:hypothetical protein Pla133_50650 [Planctomycetes bacterium Pla133]QDV04267.1 hypothetical protein Pla86_50620 [Planctomycetes bacterium Pla86]
MRSDVNGSDEAFAQSGGWTGGQYSLLRFSLGLALALYLVRLLPWAEELFTYRGVIGGSYGRDGLQSFYDPGSAQAVVGVGVVLALLFAAGLRTRWAALGLFVVWSLTHGRNPLVADSGAPFVGWVLLFHAALPQAPFGSIDARGRLDPRGLWSYPRALRIAAWTMLALTTAYSGASKLASSAWRSGEAVGGLFAGPLSHDGLLRDAFLGLPPWVLAAGTFGVLALQLAFVPLALWRPARVWIWSAMFAATLVVALAFDSPDASLGRLALLGLCFDPRWIPRQGPGTIDRVFYDGSCGLCHRVVRAAIAEDPRGSSLRFAPIDGEAFAASVPAGLRLGLPDSVLVLTPDGELLDRSRAVLRLARRAGGLWRALALAGEAVPLALRDSIYDFIAAQRHRLFATPDEACPVLTAELRERFDP